MNEERRYSESEIADIFKQASEVQETTRRRLAHNDGLSLAELQQIGKEAGITPEFISRAAATLDGGRARPRRGTYLGVPVSVGRTVEISGPLSDDGWDRLVADLRDTFQATGHVSAEGADRRWQNGNLHVQAEPTPTGHRLRFRTTNGSSRSALMGGMMSLALGLLLIVMLMLNGDWMVVMDKTFVVSMFAVLGLGSMGVAAYRLPKWAQEREAQMEAVVMRALEFSGSFVKDLDDVPARGIDFESSTGIADEAPSLVRGRIRV